MLVSDRSEALLWHWSVLPPLSAFRMLAEELPRCETVHNQTGFPKQWIAKIPASEEAGKPLISLR
jgi:hypothetical protein